MIYCANPYEAAKEEQMGWLSVQNGTNLRNLDFEKVRSLMKRPFILDGRNICDKDKDDKFGIRISRHWPLTNPIKDNNYVANQQEECIFIGF